MQLKNGDKVTTTSGTTVQLDGYSAGARIYRGVDQGGNEAWVLDHQVAWVDLYDTVGPVRLECSNGVIMPRVPRREMEVVHHTLPNGDTVGAIIPRKPKGKASKAQQALEKALERIQELEATLAYVKQGATDMADAILKMNGFGK